jgi:hypothetical protein
MYNEIQTSPAPTQRKFNGDYGFPFVAAAGEVDAGMKNSYTKKLCGATRKRFMTF